MINDSTWMILEVRKPFVTGSQPIKYQFSGLKSPKFLIKIPLIIQFDHYLSPLQGGILMVLAQANPGTLRGTQPRRSSGDHLPSQQALPELLQRQTQLPGSSQQRLVTFQAELLGDGSWGGDGGCILGDGDGGMGKGLGDGGWLFVLRCTKFIREKSLKLATPR